MLQELWRLHVFTQLIHYVCWYILITLSVCFNYQCKFRWLRQLQENGLAKGKKTLDRGSYFYKLLIFELQLVCHASRRELSKTSNISRAITYLYSSVSSCTVCEYHRNWFKIYIFVFQYLRKIKQESSQFQVILILWHKLPINIK